MALTLRKNFGFAVAGNLIYAASQYIVLLIFVKLYSVEDVGLFVYAGAFTTPIMLALEMQLRNIYITDHENKITINDYFTFRVITNLFGFVGLIIVAILMKPEYFVVILIVTLIKMFESQLDLVYGIYQKGHRLDYVAYSRIVRGIVAVVIVGSVSFFVQKLEYSLGAYLISWLVLYFFYERKQIFERGFIKVGELKLVAVEFKKLKLLLVLCLPMFFSILIDKYYLNFPRLSVEDIFGVKMLGIFGSLLYFKSLGGQFISSLAQAAIPKLSKYVLDRKIKPFNRLLFKMILTGFGIGALLSILCYWGGKPLLKFIYTEEYAHYSNVLSVILVGATVTFSYIFISSALTCIRKQWIKLPISIFSFVVLVILFRVFPIKSLLDVSLIVLWVEVLTFVIYLLSYWFYIKKEISSWDKLKLI